MLKSPILASLLSNPSSKQNASTTSMKPSRLAPSVPMHMKTRGSQKALSVMSGSVSGDSRRSSISHSLNGVGQSGDDIDQPAKRQRLSRESSIRRFSHSSDSSDDKVSISKSPKLATFSTTESISSAKRKHSDADDDDQDQQQPVDTNDTTTTLRDETENAQFLDPPLRKRLGRPPKKSKVTPTISDNGVPQAKRPPGRPPRLGRLPLSRQVSERVQRMPGRRRKPNPDAELDADLGRLADLRRNYRVLAKMAKPAISELAERTITTIENDPEAHKKCSEYQLVQEELDARLNQRIALVEREYQVKVQYEKKSLAIEEECIRMEFERKFYEIQEKYITEAKHLMMEAIRHMEATEDHEATEDEFGIVDAYQSEPEDEPASPRSLLRDVSRSVFPIETEKKWKALEARAGVAKLLETYAPDVVEDMKRHELDSYQDESRAGIDQENIRKLTSATAIVDANASIHRIGVSAMDALAELSTRLLETEDQILDKGKLEPPIPNGVPNSGAKLHAPQEHSAVSAQPIETVAPGKDTAPSNATPESVTKPVLSARPSDPLPTSAVPPSEHGFLANRGDARLLVEPAKAIPPPRDVSKTKKYGEDEPAERKLRPGQGQVGESPSTTTTATSWQGTGPDKHGDPVVSPLRTPKIITLDRGSSILNTPIQPTTRNLEGIHEGPPPANYQRSAQPLRQSGLVPLHVSPRTANMDSAVGSPIGALGSGKQAPPAISSITKSSVGKAQSIMSSSIPPPPPYVSPYGPMSEKARTHSAATSQTAPVAQQLTRPNPAQATGPMQVPPAQVQQLQHAPPARRRELRPAPNPSIPAPVVYPRYPQDNYFSNTAYGYPETETSPLGRTPETFYGYVPPYDPTGGQVYYQNGPYLHPVQPVQYPAYLIYNPPSTQPIPPTQPGPHQQGIAPLQPTFAGQPRIAPNHTAHSTPAPPPQRPLTFQYYQPPGGNQSGPSRDEQSRR
ncbi:hypothetical protein FGG08_006900 [Glutinoglossum americanum]|uniref:Uncharacterized protein n=1 Tax=Glutinoglossum americanum TaxID=1670608 RepID=A0A9P8HZY0_9PEZI|nr:hypothetical protein FGG08_006900 [Glutinoglossum americanum]